MPNHRTTLATPDAQAAVHTGKSSTENLTTSKFLEPPEVMDKRESCEVRLPAQIMEELYPHFEKRFLRERRVAESSPAPSPEPASTEADILLHSIAWVLDTYLEEQVPDWKMVRCDIDRSRGHDWFEGNKVNVTKLYTEIKPFASANSPKWRTQHKRLSEALDVIYRGSTIRKPLGAKALPTAYNVLYILSRAVCAANANEPQTVSPQVPTPLTVFNTLQPKSELPSALSLRQVRICLRTAHDHL